jgi:hypothetical protein
MPLPCIFLFGVSFFPFVCRKKERKKEKKKKEKKQKRKKKMPKIESLGRELYKGAAEVGRFSSLATAVIATGIAIGVVLLGVYLVRQARSELSTTGKATEASKCETRLQTTQRHGKWGTVSTTDTRLECLTPVEYDAQGTHFERQLSTGERRHGAGESVPVFYQPGDASNASAQKSTPALGYGMIGVSFVVVALVWASWYFARKSNVYAAVTGASALRAIL